MAELDNNTVQILTPTPEQVAALVRDILGQTILSLGIHTWKIIEPGIIKAVIDGELVVLESHGQIYFVAGTEVGKWTDKRVPVDSSRRWGLGIDWQHYGLQ